MQTHNKRAALNEVVSCAVIKSGMLGTVDI
jgi:hypothetical protein